MSPRYDFNRRIPCVELNGTAEIVILEYAPVPGFSIDQIGEALTGALYRTEDGQQAVYAIGMRAFEVEGHDKRYRPVRHFIPL